MAFISKNELEQLNFQDCVCIEFRYDGSTIKMLLEALIIRSGNSQNSNFTDSYASETTCTLENAEIVSMIKEGYKKYDANECLIEEIPDEVVSEEDYAGLYKTFQGAFLAEVTQREEGYLLVFEREDEIGTVGDTYEVRVKSQDISFSWEKYMNRVQ